MELISKERLRKLKDAWYAASLVLWVLFIVVFISQKFKDIQYTFLAVVVIFTTIPLILQILGKIIRWFKKESKIGFKSIIHTTFQMLLVLFLLALLAQQFNPDLIDKYININYFLITIIIFGVLTILTRKEKEEISEPEIKEKPTPAYYLFVIFMGIVGAFLIWYKLKTMDIGYVTYLISGLGGVLIIFLSILGLEKMEEEIPEEAPEVEEMEEEILPIVPTVEGVKEEKLKRYEELIGEALERDGELKRKKGVEEKPVREKKEKKKLEEIKTCIPLSKRKKSYEELVGGAFEKQRRLEVEEKEREEHVMKLLDFLTEEKEVTLGYAARKLNVKKKFLKPLVADLEKSGVIEVRSRFLREPILKIAQEENI